MKARAAEAGGAVDRAAAGYAAVLYAQPDNADIALRAWRQALAAGDDALAARAAKVLQAKGQAPLDVALYDCALAARTGDAAKIEQALKTLKDTPFAFIANPVRAWQAFAADKDPMPLLDAAQGSALERGYAAENRALLLIATGHMDDGVAGLRMLLGADPGGIDLRYNAAQLLAAKGRADTAHALLIGDDPMLAALSAHIGDGVQPSLAFGVSRIFTRLAADIAHGKAATLSIALTRSALAAEPGNDRARLLLADALAESDAPDRALAVLDQIAPDHPLWAVAQDMHVQVLARSGASPQAIEAAKRQSANGDAGDARQLGELLTGQKRYGEAAGAFALALKRAGKNADWTYHLQLGGALEQAGRWTEARAELVKAVEMAPDEPLALNYLGYARIEHHEDVAASEKMLQQAHQLAPANASISDSLAWAWFRRGDTARALPLLETAAAAEPANATIGEHLGDTYWAIGRRYEARYAWAAAKVSADPADLARLNAKIANGPDAHTAQAR